ncbi:cytochrome c oxidase subunit 7C, mitochondrial-like [Arvicola amphibius]|uniref:cytochrome c oxidase subunit 7C, mitochondrial-like n=1 Tax=Arvicola amphibius TaxID=1047088 RepID=UPI001C08F1E4|nr:cytochrome c oxidase subunit 7C, mitochondrial-like [Arvicola amphibius]
MSAKTRRPMMYPTALPLYHKAWATEILAKQQQQHASIALWGQSIQRFISSRASQSHDEEGPGKNWPLFMEDKRQLLAMRTMYFGSGFAVLFFIVRHQLHKK